MDENKNLEDFSRKYLEILNGDLAGLNLTRILTPKDFYEKQILDAVYPTTQSNLFQEKLSKVEAVIDIGFGGGIPLLPLAFTYPEKMFIGIEARNKKVEAVAHIAKKLKLNNVQVVHARVEDLIIDFSTLITFKAVGQIDSCLSSLNLLNLQSYIYFYKGPLFFEKEALALKKVKKNWEQIEEKSVKIPGTQGRFFLGFRPRNVPRGTRRGNNRVNLSDIVSLRGNQ